MKKWVAVGVVVAFTVCAGIGTLSRNRDVTIRVRNPTLKISTARIVHWETNVSTQVCENRTLLRQIDAYCVRLLRKLGAKGVFATTPAYASWDTGPQLEAADRLVVFGEFPNECPVFDLVETNGSPGIFERYKGSAGMPGIKDRRVGHVVFSSFTKEFATANPIPPEAHGHFFLWLRGDTNVIADVWLK
jgi:hypothetical protein